MIMILIMTIGKLQNLFRIKNKKSKRISPYLESEIWEKEELLSIIKYEPYKRNKAALTLFWDLNGRNHEIDHSQIETY